MKKKLSLILIVILISSAGAYWKFKKSKSSKINFNTITVERGNLKISVLATGVVEPQNRLEIKVPISGRLEDILVKEGESVKKGKILAWMSSTERAALLDAARAKGSQELAHWEEVYKPTPIVSPMDGIIIARSMEPGQTVTTSDVPLVMSNRLIIKAQVDETDIAKIRMGQPAEIYLDAYAEHKIKAQVNHIAYEAKTVNNVTTYEIDVVPERVPSFMRSGMTANVTFIVDHKENILLVPQDAVKERDGEYRVFTPKEDKNKKGPPPTKTVKTGISDGKKIEIIEGLQEGDQVLVAEMKWERKEETNQQSNPLSPFGGRRPGASSGSGRRTGGSGGR